MAATDYARLRRSLPRARLLFVAHRDEILEQSRATFALALRDAGFGERWVGGDRPERFEHVFASIQSLNAAGLEHLAPDHFDVVIVDEFHHAAAPSYQSLLRRVQPRELLGLTATPERADGLDVLQFFDGRIAAELRLWDAIDQQHLCPFDYFGVSDGADLRDGAVAARTGYDLDRAHQRPHRRRRVGEPRDRAGRREDRRSAADAGARLLRRRRTRALHGRAISPAPGSLPSRSPASPPMGQRRQALADLRDGRVAVIFTVDLFNEGVDLPTVDTLLMLRPTDSPTLFLQQLGRGLRKALDKPVCTVLDFVSHHRKEFRYDRRFRALLGGSRQSLDPPGRSRVSRSCPRAARSPSTGSPATSYSTASRHSVPNRWRDKCAELKAIGDVTLARYLDETGLDLDDVYDGGHSWTEMRRVAGFDSTLETPEEAAILRAVGRLSHVDDDERIDPYRSSSTTRPHPILTHYRSVNDACCGCWSPRITTLPKSAELRRPASRSCGPSAVRAELAELLPVLTDRITHVTTPLGTDRDVPLRVHARYTRLEILAALRYRRRRQADDLADRGALGRHQPRPTCSRSPSTKAAAVLADHPLPRLRDQPRPHPLGKPVDDLRSRRDGTALHPPCGPRQPILLFARLNVSDRAFWCLGPASYVTTRVSDPSPSPGGSSTVCPPTSTPRSPLLWPDRQRGILSQRRSARSRGSPGRSDPWRCRVGMGHCQQVPGAGSTRSSKVRRLDTPRSVAFSAVRSRAAMSSTVPSFTAATAMSTARAMSQPGPGGAAAGLFVDHLNLVDV